MIFRSLLVFTLLAGCTDFPALEGTVSPAARNADYPTLVSIEPMLQAAEAARLSPGATPAGDLNSRLARLRARARALRGPVIGAATLARMRAGIR